MNRIKTRLRAQYEQQSAQSHCATTRTDGGGRMQVIILDRRSLEHGQSLLHNSPSSTAPWGLPSSSITPGPLHHCWPCLPAVVTQCSVSITHSNCAQLSYRTGSPFSGFTSSKFSSNHQKTVSPISFPYSFIIFTVKCMIFLLTLLNSK